MKRALLITLFVVVTASLATFSPLCAQDTAAWADFQQKAAAWRALPVKPALSDDVKRERLLAENAVSEKRLQDALYHYQSGLKLNPMWPEGQFNAALIDAELKSYDDAIWHMRAYLELVPNAPDAEEARNQIIVWQDKAAPANGSIIWQQATASATMQFIHEKLNEQGKMNWTTHYHDSADNTNWIYQFTFEANKVVADAAACTIAYHYSIVRDGVQISDSDASFNLRDVQDVTLTTGDRRQNDNDSAAGHKTWNAKVIPPTFDLVVRGNGNEEYYFFFFDQDLANSVSSALTHAVQLCGGRSKEPF